MKRPVLLFYCQHSLGLGHLYRSLALCESLSRSFRVILLCGGKMPPGIKLSVDVELIELPPLGAAADGSIVSRDGRISLERARELRRDMILKTFRERRPETILIEFFPFGKKRFGSEIVPLLQEARSLEPDPPLIACSIRDILVSRGSEQIAHDDRASNVANRYFDVVLVHSDPEFARFEESFSPRLPLRTPIHYTGFVVPNGVALNGANRRRRELVVSAGGGIVGGPLLRAAAGAHRLLATEDVRMKLVAGPFLPEDSWRELRAQARGQKGLTLRRSVPDLAAELHTATASISQCGYNTALDILRSGVPALVVPFAQGEEDEQTRRALRLQELGAVRVLHPDDLEPRTLAQEVRALLRFEPRAPVLDLQGGPRSARILNELLAERHNGHRAASAV